MLNRIWIILVLCPLVLGCASCKWHEAEAVIAMADSIDQTQHVIYDDTAALGLVIRQLDNPMGRVFKHSTLGKAYYYMGRNLEDNHQQIAEAAKCYIEADRLHIDDPIYRGRVNTCMGYICAQNNNDSLALIFYERAYSDFKESEDDLRCVLCILDLCETNIELYRYNVVEDLLEKAHTYQLDSTCHACYCETKALYFYAQQQYDSALIYFKQGLTFWRTENDRCFNYMKIMQIYCKNNMLFSAVPYAYKLIEYSNSQGFLVNAYYCLMLYAKLQNNTEELSRYAHARADAQNILRSDVKKIAEAIPLLEEYVNNPNPLYWVWFSLASFLLICVLLFLLLIIYRKKTSNKLDVFEKKTTELSDRLIESESLLAQHKYDADLAKILKKYPTPLNQWNEYSQLRKDIEPYLHDWLIAVEKLTLTNREKVLCIFIFIYRHLSVAKIADHMNNTERAVRVLKTRVAQKLGITSAELIDYLLNLHVNK